MQKQLDELHLEEISIVAFVKFCKEVREYQSKYGKVNNISDWISKRVRNFLIAEGSLLYFGLDKELFKSLSFRAIEKLMSFVVRSEEKADFVADINEAVCFPVLPKGYSLSEDGCEVFYKALWMYVDSFKEVMQFLSLGSRCVPSVNMNKNGLMHIFVDKIPYDYGYNS